MLLIIFFWFWSPSHLIFILLGSCLFWLLASYWVWRYQKGHHFFPTSSFVKALLGLCILLPAPIALLMLHGDERYGWQWVIFLLVLIWAADTGAYFAGRRWGRIKLADKISPGKTWEGVTGALLMSLSLTLVYALFHSMSFMILLLFMLLCGLTVMASIMGDLLESLFKRQAGVKDSSQLLPGHGGILDRIDSLTAAAPIFVIGMILLGGLF